MLVRILFIFLSLRCFALQAQDLDWVKAVANDTSSNIPVMHVTPDGGVLTLVNSYYFVRNDTTDFSRGNNRLEKFNRNGDKIWSLPLSSEYAAAVYDFCVDAEGNVYFTGTFRKEMQLAGQIFTTDSSADFVAKLNADYELVWLRKSHGLYYNGLGIMPQGKVVLKGSTREKEITLEDADKSATFKTEYARNYNFTAYDLDGKLLWSKFYGGDDIGYYAGSWYTKVTKNGIYELCSWTGTIDLETGPGKTFLRNSERSSDNYYLSSYDENGDFLWVKTIQKDTTSYTGEITRIMLDADLEGNVFLAGTFYGKVDFDFTTKIFAIDKRNRNAFLENHYFICKYDKDLNLDWAKATNSSIQNSTFRFRLRIHSNGKSIYLYGVYWPGLDLDFNNPSFKLLPGSNHFFAEYDMEGNLLTARNLGEKNEYSGHSVLWNLETDKHNNVYLSGSIYNSLYFDFDPSEDSAYLPNNINNQIAYLARYQTCKKPIKIIPQYQTTDCHERLTTLYALNDHFPVRWYSETGKLLHEGITYTLPQINSPTKITAEDGCNYRDEIEIEIQNRWPNIQKIYPNPVKGNLTINIEGVQDDALNFQLINTLGQVIQSGKLTVKNGFQNVILPVDDIREGMYFLVLQNKCIRQTEKIFIVK